MRRKAIMAYNGNNYSRSNGYSDNRNNRNNGYGGNRNNDRRYQDKNKKEDGQNNSSKKKLPDKFSQVVQEGNLDLDVIDEVMKDYMKNQYTITTTKLRNIMSMISEIYNFESRSKEEKLSADSIAKLQRLRIRIVYEYGRKETNKEFKPFCDTFKILEYLVQISKEYKRADFLGYAMFFEALVAYHRYHGGKE